MRRKSHHNSNQLLKASRPAFSLLEITLVLVIIGLIMGVAAVNLAGARKRAAVRTTNATMNIMKNAVRSYMIENADNVPTSLQLLVQAEYLEPDASGMAPKDAWDQDIYFSPQPDAEGRAFQLISKGPDKQPNTEDDINVWEIEN